MRILISLLGGASALFFAMGIARFAFTPVLPLMQSDYGFSDTVAGALASSNYLGYLIGALLSRIIPHGRVSYKYFLISIPLSLILILFMYFNNIFLWYFLRFASGFFSAVIFVLAAEYVFTYLASINKIHLGGMIFSGIGGGMVLSGLTIPVLSSSFNSAQIWLWLTGLSIIPALITLLAIPKPEKNITSSGVNKAEHVPKKLYLLYFAYFIEGMGYIVTGTFISVMVLRGSGSVFLSGYVWVIAGLGAVFITPLWQLLAKKIGNVNALISAFLVQAFAVGLPAVFTNTFITTIGAVGFGGTFLGIVSMTLAYGRELSKNGHSTSVLTIYFSIGQMIGPLIAGWMSDLSGSFVMPVLSASLILVFGAFIIYKTKGG